MVICCPSSSTTALWSREELPRLTLTTLFIQALLGQGSRQTGRPALRDVHRQGSSPGSDHYTPRRPLGQVARPRRTGGAAGGDALDKVYLVLYHWGVHGIGHLGVPRQLRFTSGGDDTVRLPLPQVGQGKVLADWITESLREAILKGHFEPGERLDQDQIAAAYGVSRTP
ncbi:MAG: GntR family transcriptional regulator, partial [Chloroflexi bacterium]|nr:GntR family transcriptional regulator [Chloroflexota bacterium]